MATDNAPEQSLEESAATVPKAVSVKEVCRMLLEGDLGEPELVPWGSNYTFAVSVTFEEECSFLAIYKPLEGEAPLWDFPKCLYKREVAAFIVSEEMGWGLVPPTVIRSGPHGVGSLQLYVPPDQGTDYSTLQENHPDALKRIALFDMIINNADRKAGHCFLGTDGRVWGIDHGLAFHAYPKLRTVIWEFRDEPIPREFLPQVKWFREVLEHEQPLAGSLSEFLSAEEIQSMKLRLEIILDDPVYPSPTHHKHYPWPPY